MEFPDEEWIPPIPRSAIQLSSEGDDEAQLAEGEVTQRRPTKKPKRKKRKAAAGNASPTKRVTGRQALTGSVANFPQTSTSAATGTGTSFTAPNPEERDPNPEAAEEEDLTSPIDPNHEYNHSDRKPPGRNDCCGRRIPGHASDFS